MMADLGRRAFGGAAILLGVMAILLTASSWSLTYWQGWIYWLVFASCVLSITMYLLIYDPALLRRRLEAGPAAEREASQKIIQSVAGLLAITFVIMPGLDHRFAWSELPVVVIAIGDVVVACGFLIVFLVFRQNSFTTAVITVEEDQPVISTGPYSVIRHPMYAGALLIFLGTPPALGSAWSLPLFLPMTAVILKRMVDEERYLRRNLAGYAEYCRKVRGRIIPFSLLPVSHDPRA